MASTPGPSRFLRWLFNNRCRLLVASAAMKSPAELTEAFRAQGLKVTPQRQCIFAAL